MIWKQALNGLVNSIQTIPMEKIWMPDPDMYSMMACMGRDLAGLYGPGQEGDPS